VQMADKAYMSLRITSSTGRPKATGGYRKAVNHMYLKINRNKKKKHLGCRVRQSTGTDRRRRTRPPSRCTPRRCSTGWGCTCSLLNTNDRKTRSNGWPWCVRWENDVLLVRLSSQLQCTPRPLFQTAAFTSLRAVRSPFV